MLSLTDKLSKSLIMSNYNQLKILLALSILHDSGENVKQEDELYSISLYFYKLPPRSMVICD